MATASYTKKPVLVAKQGAVKVTKPSLPKGKYKDVTPKSSTGVFKKGQTLGSQNPHQGKINEAPGYSKLAKKLLKKGLQTNYSK